MRRETVEAKMLLSKKMYLSIADMFCILLSLQDFKNKFVVKYSFRTEYTLSIGSGTFLPSHKSQCTLYRVIRGN